MYIIKEEIKVSSIGVAEIFLITACKRNSKPMPSVLEFTIYLDASNFNDAVLAASKRLVGTAIPRRRQ